MSITREREMQRRIRRILEQNGIAFDGSKYLANSPDNRVAMHKKKMARTPMQSDVLSFGFQGVVPSLKSLNKKIKKVNY